MKTLEELLLEDFVLCFFDRKNYLSIERARKFFLEDSFMDAFPKNEICEEARETSVTDKCGYCLASEYLPANYIED